MARGLLNRSLSAIGQNPKARRLQYRLVDVSVNRLLPALTLRTARKSPITISERFLLQADRQQKGRLFLPAGTPPADGWPVALGWHGGGWAMGHPDNLAHVAAALAEKGMAVLLADYALTPKFRWPSQLRDIQAAMTWVATQKMATLNSERMAVFGDSAGAHLSACCLTHSHTRISAAVLYYGVYDFVRLARWNHPMTNDMLWALFGHQWRDETILAAASPAQKIPANGPPVFAMVGSLDPLLRQSERFVADWQAAGNDARLKIYPNSHHAFVNALGMDICRSAVEATVSFLQDHLV